MFDDIAEGIGVWVTRVINSTYSSIVQIQESLSWLDTPGTHILWMIIGFIYIPFLAKSAYYQFANPHEYYTISLTRKVLMGIIFITAWIVLGYANLRRFIR